jgi:hypothetical protein
MMKKWKRVLNPEVNENPITPSAVAPSQKVHCCFGRNGRKEMNWAKATDWIMPIELLQLKQEAIHVILMEIG